MRFALPLLLVTAVFGCAGLPTESGDPALVVVGSDSLLRTSATLYAPGASGELILSNTLNHPIGYNLCTASLERRQGSTWVSAENGDRVCTMELRLLQPGGTASFRFTLRADLPPGEYRYSTRLENMSTGVGQVHASNTFGVRR